MNVAAQAKWALLALTLLSSIGYCHQRDRGIAERAAHEERVKIHRQVVDSLALIAEQARQGAIRAQVRADSVRVASDSVVAQMRDQISDLRERRPAVVDTVVLEAGADSAVVRQAVERVAVSYEAEISALQAITAKQLGTINGQDSLIVHLTAQTQADAALIGALRAQVEASQHARASWLERNTGRLALAAGSALLGAVAWEAVR